MTVRHVVVEPFLVAYIAIEYILEHRAKREAVMIGVEGRNGKRNLAKDCRGTVLTTPNTR